MDIIEANEEVLTSTESVITPADANSDAMEVLEDQNRPIPSKLHLRGVDDLSTNEIKSYLDQHIKPNYSYAKREEYKHLDYRLEWINDSELNVSFISEDPKLAEWGATESLNSLKVSSIGEENQELEPLQERRCWDLLRITEGKGAGKVVVKSNAAKEYLQSTTSESADSEIQKPVEDSVICLDPIAIFVRYSTPSDRKIANAREQSRYYLIHGEPDELERGHASRQGYRRGRFYEDGQPDLITGEIRPRESGDNYRSRDDHRRYNNKKRNNRYTSLDDVRDDYRGQEFNNNKDGRGRPGRRDKRRRREPARDKEGDLFPELLAKRDADREREKSPSRMEQ